MVNRMLSAPRFKVFIARSFDFFMSWTKMFWRILNDSLEELIANNEELCSIVEEIDAYCRSNYIKGYHYTRADPKSIKKEGLLCRNATEIQENFIENTLGFSSFPTHIIVSKSGRILKVFSDGERYLPYYLAKYLK